MDGFKKPRCEDCRVFAALDETKGECRLKPPRPIGLNTLASCPEVGVDHWCGQWRNVRDELFYLWDVVAHPHADDP